MKHRIVAGLVAALSCITLAACGGGGSGGGGPTLPPPPPPPGSQEPAPPMIPYTGNRAPAIVDRDSARYYATLPPTLAVLVELAESMWITSPGQAGPINQTVSGDSGTATITGEMISTQTGYISVIFDAFSEAGLLIDGSYLQRYRPQGTPPTTGGQRFSEAGNGSIEFDGLQITIGGVTLTLHGVVEITGFFADRFNIDLMASDSITNNPVYFENFTLDYSLVSVTGDLRPSKAFAGTINDEVFGAVTLSTVAPFPDFDPSPISGVPVATRGGAFRFTGAGMTFEMHALSRAFAGLMIDTDGDQDYDEGLRISWSELAGDLPPGNSVMIGPIANAGEDVFAHTGEQVTLHALFSHDDDGDWLSFRWRPVHLPFGSQVTFPPLDGPSFTFVPDIDGDFLFELRATDGAGETVTTVMVRSDSFSQFPVPESTRVGALEVAEPFQVGAPFMIDGRGSTNRPFGSSPPSWFSEGPGIRTLTDTVDPHVKEFSVDTAGRYTVHMNESSGLSSVEGVFTELALNIESVHYDRILKIVTDHAGRKLLSADYNNDGHDDFIVVVGAFGAIGFLTFTADGNGGFIEGPLVESGFGEPAVGDLNGDGRMDVAVADGAEVYVSYQAVDESFGTPVTYNISCDSPFGTQDIGVGDIDGDGRDDLLALNDCDATIEYWMQDANGSLGALQVQPFNERVIHAAFDYVDADNRLDVVFAGWDPDGIDDNSVIYALGQADGSFLQADQFFNIATSGNSVPAIGDTNGDGRKDLVVMDFTFVTIYEQQADGSMLLASTTDTNMTLGSAYASLGDVDSDGDADILVCRLRELHVGERQADGSYVFNEIGECEPVDGNPDVGVVTDIDGDGLNDLVLPATDDGGAFRNREETLDIYLRNATDYARPVPQT